MGVDSNSVDVNPAVVDWCLRLVEIDGCVAFSCVIVFVRRGGLRDRLKGGGVIVKAHRCCGGVELEVSVLLEGSRDVLGREIVSDCCACCRDNRGLSFICFDIGEAAEILVESAYLLRGLLWHGRGI